MDSKNVIDIVKSNIDSNNIDFILLKVLEIGSKQEEAVFIQNETRGIQLYDVTVGYFARLFNFCKGKSFKELKSIREKLGKDELEVLKLSKIIMDYSDKENTAYFHSIVPISDRATWVEFAY